MFDPGVQEFAIGDYIELMGDEVFQVEEETIQSLDRAILSAPWGSLSKAELEYLLFESMSARGVIDLASSDFVLASNLRTTPSRVRSLRFRWEQRNGGDLDPLRLAMAIVPHSIAGERQIFVRVENSFLLDWLVEEMGRRRYLVRRELTRGLLRVEADELLNTIDELAGKSSDISKYRNLIDAIRKESVRSERQNRVRTFVSDLNQTHNVYSMVERVAALFVQFGT